MDAGPLPPPPLVQRAPLLSPEAEQRSNMRPISCLLFASFTRGRRTKNRSVFTSSQIEQAQVSPSKTFGRTIKIFVMMINFGESTYN